MGHALQFGILGPLEVVDDRPLSLGGPKQRAVLALLLLNRRNVISTDRLIDELWNGRAPATAGKTIQVYVSNLRKALNNDVLVTRGRGYLLAVKPDQVDADRFEELAQGGREALEKGYTELACDRLRAALAEWRGPPLADFATEEFAQSEITRLEESRLVALEDRIAAELALGQHLALVPEIEAFARAHPLRERLYAQLMLALYRSGRQADALARYQQARRMLIDEYALEPSPQLKEMERAILNQDPRLSLPAPPPSHDRRRPRDRRRERRPADNPRMPAPPARKETQPAPAVTMAGAAASTMVAAPNTAEPSTPSAVTEAAPKPTASTARPAAAPQPTALEQMRSTLRGLYARAKAERVTKKSSALQSSLASRLGEWRTGIDAHWNERRTVIAAGAGLLLIAVVVVAVLTGGAGPAKRPARAARSARPVLAQGCSGCIAAISSPASGAVYRLGETVPTRFSCTGSAVVRCSDSTGTSTVNGGQGHLDTSTPGIHIYAVTAASKSGATKVATIPYTVVAPLAVSLETAVANVANRQTQILVACTGGRSKAVCHGELKLSIMQLGRHVRVLIASAAYTIPAGARRPVVLQVSREGVKLLRRARGHQRYALVRLTLEGGAPSKRTITLQLG